MKLFRWISAVVTLSHKSALYFAPFLVLLALICGGFGIRFGTDRTPPKSFVLSQQSSGFSDRRCAECHADILRNYSQAPHARTLTRATDESVLYEFAGKRFRREDTGVDFQYERENGQLVLSTSAFSRKLPIDWIFGSGTHARTPLITWTDANQQTSSLEHCVSAYPDGSLGTTLGMDELQESAGILALGHPRSPSETLNCFGCHCSHVAVQEDRIVVDAIQPGISCSRCHWDSERHANEMENDLEPTTERLTQLTPLESVDRCGECHRRADEMGARLDPADKTLARFASVGLIQSQCFVQQATVPPEAGVTTRLDCTSCHDPHRPARRDWQFHTTVCLSCHDQAHLKAVDCTVASRTENCLTCHMPRVSSGEHLEFTDHWIRIPQQKPEPGRASIGRLRNP